VAWRIAPVRAMAVDEHIIAARRTHLARDLRIVFASDFHAGPATASPLIEMAVEQIAALEPDLLLLGGDFVSIDPRHGTPLFARLARLHAPLGRYAVLGNHDYWSGAPSVVAQLQDAGIELLTNRTVRLPPPFEPVTISGLDDYTSGEPDGDAALAAAGEIRVVLMHQPSGLEQLGDHQFDVALCGHTHGGQIAWRGGVPLMVASGPLSRQYNAGRYDLPGQRTLIVSRGVGCGTLPIRINAPSSVVLCTLRAG
jgi:predicted MPP superfamily phosphohydrolase